MQVFKGSEKKKSIQHEMYSRKLHVHAFVFSLLLPITHKNLMNGLNKYLKDKVILLIKAEVRNRIEVVGNILYLLYFAQHLSVNRYLQ